MDSWTVQQLDVMKAGGNNSCNTFLLEKGNIASSTPIRQKYDNPTATYYKDVLKARVEGKPIPAMPIVTAATNKPSSSNDLMGKKKEEDPYGRERLSGETDEQYIARQTRLRDEARARLAAKGFGASSSMSSSSSSRSYMQGIGSDASYDSSRGGYSNSNSSIVDIAQVTDTIASGLGSAWSSLGNVANSVLKDDKNIVGSLSGTVFSTGAGLWSSFSSAAQNVAKNLTAPDMMSGNADTSTNDALMELQEMARAAKTNKYAGFGSDHFQNTNSNTMQHSSSSSFHASENYDVPTSPKQMEQFDGESNEQYMERQSRILNDARVRVEARFEGSQHVNSKAAALRKDNGSSESFHSTASAPSAPKSSAATRMKLETSDDFFSSFGA